MEYCVPRGIPHSEFLSWDDDDQDKALAFMREKKLVCESCGTREEEWDNDHFAYVTWTKRCTGCELVEQEREQLATEHDTKGMKIMLVPREWALAQIEVGNLGS